MKKVTVPLSKKRRKRSLKSNRRNTPKRLSRFYGLLLLFIILPLFVIALQYPQVLKQFAQTTYTIPPMFGCLTMGASNKTNCASLVATSEYALTFHGKPLREKIVYYGDTITATVTYKNAGDKPMQIRSMGMAAGTHNGKYRIDFTQKHQATTIEPGRSITLAMTSHKFNSPDPGGEWDAFTTLTDSHGQTVDDRNNVTRFRVDTTCTALRRQDVTTDTINALTTYCRGKATGLCHQVCEIAGGENCAGPATISTSKDGQPGPVCNNATDLSTGEIDTAISTCIANIPPEMKAFTCKNQGNYCDNSASVSPGGCNSGYCGAQDSRGRGRCAPPPTPPPPVGGIGGGSNGNGVAFTNPATRPNGGGAAPGNIAPKKPAGGAQPAGAAKPATAAPAPKLALPGRLPGPGDVPGMNSVPKLVPPPARPVPLAPPPSARCDGPSGPGPCGRTG